MNNLDLEKLISSYLTYKYEDLIKPIKISHIDINTTVCQVLYCDAEDTEVKNELISIFEVTAFVFSQINSLKITKDD
jgi:hypothetical protein